MLQVDAKQVSNHRERAAGLGAAFDHAGAVTALLTALLTDAEATQFRHELAGFVP